MQEQRKLFSSKPVSQSLQRLLQNLQQQAAVTCTLAMSLNGEMASHVSELIHGSPSSCSQCSWYWSWPA